jgi:hypothetical protein
MPTTEGSLPVTIAAWLDGVSGPGVYAFSKTTAWSEAISANFGIVSVSPPANGVLESDRESNINQTTSIIDEKSLAKIKYIVVPLRIVSGANNV